MSTNNSQLSLEAAMDELRKFNKDYKSFSTDKKYLIDTTARASGLLRDAAATTTRLRRDGKFEEVKQHEYAKEYLAALVMFYCYQKGSCYESTNSKVYSRILETIKEASDSEKYEKLSLRELLKKGFNSVASDQMTVEEDGNEYNIKTDIFRGGYYYMNLDSLHNLLDTMVDLAFDENFIDEDEAQIICYTYGLGQGFEDTDEQDIAAKLGKNWTLDETKKRRKKAFGKVERFIKQSDKKAELDALLNILDKNDTRFDRQAKALEDQFWNEENNI